MADSRDELTVSLRQLVDRAAALTETMRSSLQKKSKSKQSEREGVLRVVQAIALALLPVAVGFTGHFINITLKERDTQVRMVELAVSILKAEPDEDVEGGEQLRDWGIQVLQRYSGVTFKDEAREKLLVEPLRIETQRSSPGPADILRWNLPAVGSRNLADVGFWNLDHFNDRVSDERVSNVADIISHMEIDILAVAEVEGGSLNRLATSLSASENTWGHIAIDIPGSQELGLIYNERTARVVSAPALVARYSEQITRKTPAGRTFFPRAPLFAKCYINKGTRELSFVLIAVHLKSFGDPQSRERRIGAVGALREIVADVATSENMPVVLVGSFNETLENGVLDPLTSSGLLGALTESDAERDVGSYIGGSRRSLIDHMFTTDNLRVAHYADGAVIELDQVASNFENTISDHLPLVVGLAPRD